MCMGTEAVFVSGVRVHNVPRPGIGQASRAVELNLAPLVHMTHAHLSDETCVKHHANLCEHRLRGAKDCTCL